MTICQHSDPGCAVDGGQTLPGPMVHYGHGRGSRQLIELHGDHDEYHRMNQWLKQMMLKEIYIKM